MKIPALIASLLAVVALSLPLHAAPSWAVLWFPWNATYASWDWTTGPRSLTIEAVDPGDSPVSVKQWSLAVCSASDPAKKALIPLEKPQDADLSSWTPGRFPVAQLDALGEDTFLCAILGDGQRYSNVSRVIISHTYQRTPTPGVQVFALPFPDPDVRRVAVRVVPAGEDGLHAMDLAYPVISVNGNWSMPAGMRWAGLNPLLNPGRPYVEIIDLDNYAPPITPFKKARVQVKIIENWDKAFAALPPAAPGQDRSAAIATWVKDQPGPTSPVSTLTATETDAINFDLAFDLK